jgi:hypothetical protein
MKDWCFLLQHGGSAVENGVTAKFSVYRGKQLSVSVFYSCCLFSSSPRRARLFSLRVKNCVACAQDKKQMKV